jgi:type II secretory pathway component GspD/PulD (secretin)
VSPTIDKRLTVNLPPMPVDKLLALLCRAACLDLAADEGGAYRVNDGTVTDPASYWASHMRRIPLHYIPAESALRVLPASILRYVDADVGNNVLIVSGPPVLLDKVAADLAVLDQPGKQIRVKVLLVEVLDAREADRIMSAFVRNGRTGWSLDPVAGHVAVGVVPDSLRDIEAALTVPMQRGVVRTEARPEVSVLSGREARIFLGKRVFYTYTMGYEDYFWSELAQLDVGVTLKATPWTGDGVQITVPYEVSADEIMSRDSKGLLTIGRQRAQGSLRVRSGETIIFSGLRLHEVSRQRQSPLGAGPAGDLTGARWATGSDHEVLVCLSAETIPAPPATR